MSMLDAAGLLREAPWSDIGQAADSPVFSRVAELGKEFEAGLPSLLFDDPELLRWVREYLVF